MRTITYVSAIVEALREEMERDERVFLLGQGLQDGGSYKTAVGLLDRFGPERVRDTPIVENTTVGCAVGAAITGMRPIVDILYSDFTLLALDQIANQAAKYRYMSGGRISVPLTIRTACGYGRGRGAQHSQSLDASYMRFPGLKVAIPSTPRDVKGLLKAAVRDDNPVIVVDAFVLFPTKGEVPDGDVVVPLGQADVKRAGTDVTVVAFSTMVLEALRAAEALAQESIDVEVIDPRTIVPLDLAAILASVRKTNRLVIAEPGGRRGGLGADVLSAILPEAFDYLDAPPVQVAAADVPIPFAKAMEEAVVPDHRRIVSAIRELAGKPRPAEAAAGD